MIATDGALRLPVETRNRRTNASLLFYTILDLRFCDLKNVCDRLPHPNPPLRKGSYCVGRAMPDLYPYGEASYAQRLPFSQRERLAPREKHVA